MTKKHFLACVALAASSAVAVAGCSRRVVIAPSQVPARNDLDWSIRQPPASPPPAAPAVAAPPVAVPPAAAPPAAAP